MTEYDTGIMAGSRKVTICAAEEPMSEQDMVELGHIMMKLLNIEGRREAE